MSPRKLLPRVRASPHRPARHPSRAPARSVFASARKLAALQDLCAQGVEAVELDVTSQQSAEAAVGEVLRAAGRIDVLINNAGGRARVRCPPPTALARTVLIAEPPPAPPPATPRAGVNRLGPAAEQPWEEVEAIMGTNLLGALRMMRVVAPQMAARRSGVIINIGRWVGGCVGGWAGGPVGGARARVLPRPSTIALPPPNPRSTAARRGSPCPGLPFTLLPRQRWRT